MAQKARPGRVTLQTLADELGVSRSTVSNAFGRPDQLSDDLRARILERARKRGFTGPDPMARGLRRGRVGAVGVLVDQGLSYAFSDPATVASLDGLAAELSTGGFGLLLHAGTGYRADVQLVASAAVDAWVVASLPCDAAAVRIARAQGKPMVVLDQPALVDIPVVRVDDEGGAAAAASHLIEHGHRRLGVLCTALQPDEYQGIADVKRQSRVTYEVMGHRLRGVQRVVTEAGLQWEDVPVVECAFNDVDTGALGTWELLERRQRPTAIIALSDQLAFGALRAAAELGVDVPGELSVTGFDDTAAAATSEPPLTTVSQPLRRRGESAGRLVRRLVDGESVEAPPPFAVDLIVRGSSGPAPS